MAGSEAKPKIDKHDKLKSLIAEFPQSPGVYMMKNAKGKIIYIGKAKSLKARVRSYFVNGDHSLKTKFLVSHIVSIEYMLTKTEVEAFLLEASLIKKFKPRYNIRLKDDKAYPYIRVSVGDAFPRFYLARRVQSDGAIYFGPYTSGLYVRETIKFLNRTFKIRDCSDAFMKVRKRPCMTYEIGRCSAPCVDLISKKDYQQDIKAALDFLKGKDKSVVREITKRMKESAQVERFEMAAKYRDSLEAIKAILEKQAVVNASKDLDQDVVAWVGDERGTLVETIHIRGGRMIGHRPHFLPRVDLANSNEDIRDWITSFLNQYYAENVIPDEIILQMDLGGDLTKLFEAVLKERGKRARIKPAIGEEGLRLMGIAQANAKSHFQEHVAEREHQKKGLEEIKEKFHLKQTPGRIEAFDISNFQGAQNVASQVVFEDGLPKKEDYRLYKIKSVRGANDFASMFEVLSRRLKHTELEDPDLIVIDGGKGQLKAALQALKELKRPDIAAVAMAKARVEGDFSDLEVHGSKERFFLPNRQNYVVFREGSEALNILVALRDEAHRFAITFHRKLRGQATLSSELDLIVGLGEKRKQILLSHFDSIEAIRAASVEDIAELASFNRLLAERVVLHLNQSAPTIEESGA